MKQQIEAKKAKILAKIEKLNRKFDADMEPLQNELEKLDAILTVLGDHEAKTTPANNEIPAALRNMVKTENA
jgi:uncharacterized membrane protein YgaE (UPF0421/DUF939 family)